MPTATPPALQRASPPGSDLRRIAADLDHVRTLGGVGAGRLRSLAVAAAVLRELADAHDGIAGRPVPRATARPGRQA